eukprot:m.261489 g.261489  ORF g.261489 m.261489 type:complete len:198 (+) comp26669_c0_seq3:327-920(+)
MPTDTSRPSDDFGWGDTAAPTVADPAGDFQFVMMASSSKTELVGTLCSDAVSPVPSITINVAPDTDTSSVGTAPSQSQSPVSAAPSPDPDDAVSRFLRRRASTGGGHDDDRDDRRTPSPVPPSTGRGRFGSNSGRGKDTFLAVQGTLTRSVSEHDTDTTAARSRAGRRSASVDKKPICCLKYSSKGLSRCADCGKKW